MRKSILGFLIGTMIFTSSPAHGIPIVEETQLAALVTIASQQLVSFGNMLSQMKSVLSTSIESLQVARKVRDVAYSIGVLDMDAIRGHVMREIAHDFPDFSGLKAEMDQWGRPNNIGIDGLIALSSNLEKIGSLSNRLLPKTSKFLLQAELVNEDALRRFEQAGASERIKRRASTRALQMALVDKHLGDAEKSGFRSDQIAARNAQTAIENLGNTERLREISELEMAEKYAEEQKQRKGSKQFWDALSEAWKDTGSK